MRTKMQISSYLRSLSKSDRLAFTGQNRKGRDSINEEIVKRKSWEKLHKLNYK